MELDARMGSLEHLLERRVTAEDLQQNFATLKDLLMIKFSQVDDVKDAIRDLLVYNKYFVPIYM